MFVVALRSVFAQKYPVLVTLAMSNLPSSAFLSSLSPPRRSISSRTRTCDTGGRVPPLPSEADTANVLPDIHYNVTCVTQAIVVQDKLRSELCFVSPSMNALILQVQCLTCFINCIHLRCQHTQHILN